mmetsp:Transcript_9053/g.22222  ORF Transcript_9053/g.22222 Transcript_9053/m.22222 type:complete len:110 (+) Transcript_9053:389-718(+)
MRPLALPLPPAGAAAAAAAAAAASAGGTAGAGGAAVMPSDAMAPSLEAYILHWRRFGLVRQLIEADFSQFLERKEALRRHFTKQELYSFLTLAVYLNKPVEEAYNRLMD